MPTIVPPTPVESYILQLNQLGSEARKKLPALKEFSDSFSVHTQQLIKLNEKESVLEIDALKNQVRLYREAEKVHEAASLLYGSMIEKREHFYDLRRNILYAPDARDLVAGFQKIYGKDCIYSQYEKAQGKLKTSLSQAKKKPH